MNIIEDRPSSISQIDIEEEMLTLYQAVSANINSQPKVISFISSNVGEGTTTIVREFATLLALKLEKITLIVDADYSSKDVSMSNLYLNQIDYGLDKVITEDKPINRALFQVGNINLYISPFTQSGNGSSLFLKADKIANFFKKLRQRFDFIIIDFPAEALHMVGLNLASLADGVVMVFEADKTNWNIAENAKKKILKNGGKILGLVFNKKRNYIPGFIDRQL